LKNTLPVTALLLPALLCATSAASAPTDAGMPEATLPDPVTGLTWQATPSVQGMRWSAAVKQCAALKLDGGGWRLPSVEELDTLLVTDTRARIPTTATTFFWTSTHREREAVAVFFDTSTFPEGLGPARDLGLVRCVRGSADGGVPATPRAAYFHMVVRTR
jgi:hypothetical protein